MLRLGGRVGSVRHWQQERFCLLRHSGAFPEPSQHPVIQEASPMQRFLENSKTCFSFVYLYCYVDVFTHFQMCDSMGAPQGSCPVSSGAFIVARLQGGGKTPESKMCPCFLSFPLIKYLRR